MSGQGSGDSLIDLEECLTDAFTLLDSGISEDVNENYEAACEMYIEAVDVLMACISKEKPNRRKFTRILIAQVLERAESPSASVATFISKVGYFYFERALTNDENGSLLVALDRYKAAAGLVLKAAQLEEDTATQNKLKGNVADMLNRAEALSKKTAMANSTLLLSLPSPPSTKPTNIPSALAPSSSSGTVSEYLSAEEKRLLVNTSTINGRLFLPWCGDENKEQFYSSKPFLDPDGQLALSPTQSAKFRAWKRPSQIVPKKYTPQMIYLISAYTVKQTIVTDCSFVCALAVTAAYERRHKKPLITRCIYPQSANGTPIYNSSGKYMIKLWLNGVPRKVVVDDLLPVDSNGRLLCSYSKNKCELWVSIIEKAFLKVNNGYDFDGSNSGIDLMMLTGWIPERVPLEKGMYNSDREFRRMINGQKYGDCLITIATSTMTSEEEDALGLVGGHAYAVLGVEEVMGLKLLLVKNPWAHKIWKGAFSERDPRWTPELRRALDYDISAGQRRDNGVFYMCWEDVQKHFGTLYMSWNPELFAHHTKVHSAWSAKQTPKYGGFHFAHNPQFLLQMTNIPQKGVVWILLTKHITDKRMQDDDFLCLHVYNKDKGARIYNPSNHALHSGVCINSPHYLVRLDVEPGDIKYSVIVARFEPKNDITFSLDVYSTQKFKLDKIARQLAFETYLEGEWNKENSTGNISTPYYWKNPSFAITISHPCSLLILAETNDAIRVNATLVKGRANKKLSANPPKATIISSSGPYRLSLCVLQVTNIQKGSYILVVSTFDAGCIGPFTVHVGSSETVDVKPL